MSTDKCESCRINPVETERLSFDSSVPYKLCRQCVHRLENRALRPLEYFNLASIHGQPHDLHDDFYDDETGEATQPNIDVIDADKFPYPDINEIRNNLPRLIDLAVVQNSLDKNVFELIRNADKSKILECLDKKNSYNHQLGYKIYFLVGCLLEDFAADWLRDKWKNSSETEILNFSFALANCLPTDEAFETIKNAVDKTEDKNLAMYSHAFMDLNSSLSLKWIESVKDRIKNVSVDWGVLAASSQFDWPTAKKWLEIGRPLSLISLDALYYCLTTPEKQNRVLNFQENPPKLIDPDRPEIIAKVLTDYLKNDNVHRTKTTIDSIINDLFNVV